MTHAHNLDHVSAAAMPRVDARAVAGGPDWDLRGMSSGGDSRSIRVVLQ